MVGSAWCYKISLLQDSGIHYDVMMTNTYECFNDVLKHAIGLLI